MKKVLLTLLIFCTQSAWATLQGGLGMEISVGYPQMSIATNSLNAKYSGVSTQGNVLFPLMSLGQFSVDFDLSYRYNSLENNSSSAGLSEWAHFNGYGTGLRFNYSFLFAGVDYLFMRAKHVRAGTSNEIFDYKFNPTQWHAGVSIPLSPVTSVAAGYSQMLTSNVMTQGQNLKINEQVFWLRIQIDFGVSFFNLLEPTESFESTRNGFFIQ